MSARIEREEQDLVTLLNELRRWSGGSAPTPELARYTEMAPRRAIAALRLGELRGFVTSKRGGGMTHGRPLWWRLTTKGREALK